MKRAMRLMAFLLTCAICVAQPQPLAIQNVKGGIYLAKGGNGANTGFFIGEKEVVLIDAKMTAEAEKQVLEEIRKLTSKPVAAVILTHSDGDHVNGLNGLPTGLKIYGHPRTAQDLEQAAQSPNMSYLREYVPNQVCSPCAGSKESAMALRMGGEEINLYYFGPAHTSGDFVVHFPAERVAFVGDLAFVGRDPLVHRQKGGTSAGYLHLLESMLSLGADTFLSGHNDPLTRQDIRHLYTAMSEKRDKVKAMVAEGKSLEEVRKSFGVPESPAGGRPRFPSLVEVMYLELTGK